MELLGTPVVALASTTMIGYVAAKYNGAVFLYQNGCPARAVAVPFPFAGIPQSMSDALVSGNDPRENMKVTDEIIRALTIPLGQKYDTTGLPAGITETDSGIPAAATPEPRLLPAGTEDSLNALFKANDWTDYNPIVLPTEARVQAMLKGTSLAPDFVIKTVTWPPGARKITVEKVAICAVMVGATPKMFPTILAISKSIPYGNSTTSMSNAMVFNGPIRQELGINSGMNAMGPYAEANAILGRSLTIMSKSLANMHSGPFVAASKQTTFSSIGSNIQYNNVCIGENEEMLPNGWKTIAEVAGYTKDQSIVTIGTGWTYISSVGEVQLSQPPQMWIADYMHALSGQGGASVFMDPSVARILAEAYGFADKLSLQTYFTQNVTKTARQYWGNGVIATFSTGSALQGIEPYATWKNLEKTAPDTLIKFLTSPTAISIIVVGGGTQTTWFAADFRIGKGTNIADYK